MKRRLLAALADYCVMLGWLALLAAVFVPLTRAGHNPLVGPVDLVAFAASVLPVWLYLTLTEAGARHATLGKRRFGLRVVRTGGQAVQPGRIAVRNAVKLLPWQLAHLGVTAYLAAPDSRTLVGPGLGWLPLTASYVLFGVSVAVVLVRRDRAALHDLVADTRVVRPVPEPTPGRGGLSDRMSVG